MHALLIGSIFLLIMLFRLIELTDSTSFLLDSDVPHILLLTFKTIAYPTISHNLSPPATHTSCKRLHKTHRHQHYPPTLLTFQLIYTHAR